MRAAMGLRELGITHLLSWGLAGGLSVDLPAGQLLLPRIVVDEAGLQYPTDEEWYRAAHDRLSELEPNSSPLLGADHAIVSIEEKRRIAHSAQPAPVAVDMESHVAARVARRYRLKFLVIRSIVDTAAMTLPPAAQISSTADGRTSLPAIMGSLLRHPGQLPELIRLGRAAGRAQRTLLRSAGLGLGIIEMP